MKLVFLLFGFSLFAPAASTHWIGTWGASASPQPVRPEEMLAGRLLFRDQTIRETVHVSAGGNRVRLRLSNAYGRDSVTIGAVHIALRDHQSAIVAGSDHVVTFSGRPSIAIPADATALSDPIEFKLPEAGDVAISIFLPKATAAGGIHYAAQQTAYIAEGDATAATTLEHAATITSWVFLTGLDVEAPSVNSTIVAFGDSITDGAKSSVDANQRWPNLLAQRLLSQRTAGHFGVLDEGIGGNRILHDGTEIRFGVNALARFDRDVIAQPGVRYVIVLEGINDIGHPGQSAPISQTVSADDLIAGYKQMIERAHEHGIKIIGGTLTPFAVTTIPNYYSSAKESIRLAVNEWIRNSHAFDGIIDFEKAVRDPAHPDKMLPAYDGGDHLHPGDAGYRAMADAVDLALFQ